MLRKVVKTMVVGGAMLAMVGAANAAEININLYGASAQYLFWNDTADEFITNALSGNVTGQAEDADGKNGITSGTLPNGDIINIRYTAKASFDGVYAAKGVLAASVSDPCATSVGPTYRSMAKSLTDTSTACYEVTLGASDVDGQTFGQRSKGPLKGHLGGTVIDRNVPVIDTIGMTSYQPLVVPFAFFASSDAPADNLTRLQALMIFSGKAFTWDQFGYADTRDIVACHRHAGSGTQATLMAAVVRDDTVIPFESGGPYFWYNDGSSDMMRCIEQRGGLTSGAAAAVGFADADQAVGGTTSYPNVKLIKYEGADASKSNIINGVYSFWSTQWLFETNPSDPVTHPIVLQLMAFAADPANLPVSKAAFWAADGEMNVTKANDFTMPSF